MFRKLRRKLRRRGAKVGAAKLARASRRGSKTAAGSLVKKVAKRAKTAAGKKVGGGLSAAAKARRRVRGVVGAIGKARTTAGKMVKKPLRGIRRPGKGVSAISIVGSLKGGKRRGAKAGAAKGRRGPLPRFASAAAKDRFLKKLKKGASGVVRGVGKKLKKDVKKSRNVVKKATGAEKKVRRKLFGGVRRRLKKRFGFDAGGRYDQKMYGGGRMGSADKDFMGGGMMKKSYGHGGKNKSGGSYRQLD